MMDIMVLIVSLAKLRPRTMSYVQVTENVKDQEPEKEMENAPVILVIVVKLALSVPKDITIHMKV